MQLAVANPIVIEYSLSLFMVTKEGVGKKWGLKPDVQRLSEHTYTLSGIGDAFRKLAILEKMGRPSNEDQETAFEIIADGIIAEAEGGKELRARVVGSQVGRLQRNMEYYHARRPEAEKWERRVIAELGAETRQIYDLGFGPAYEQERDNPLYGVWSIGDIFGKYLHRVNSQPWEEINPVLHRWFERYIAAEARDITPRDV